MSDDRYTRSRLRRLRDSGVPTGPLTTTTLPAIVATSGARLHSVDSCGELRAWGGPRRKPHRTLFDLIEDPAYVTDDPKITVCDTCTGEDLLDVDDYLSSALTVRRTIASLRALTDDLERGSAHPCRTKLQLRLALDPRMHPPGTVTRAQVITDRLPADLAGRDQLYDWATGQLQFFFRCAALDRIPAPVFGLGTQLCVVYSASWKREYWPQLDEGQAAIAGGTGPVGWLHLPGPDAADQLPVLALPAGSVAGQRSPFLELGPAPAPADLPAVLAATEGVFGRVRGDATLRDAARFAYLMATDVHTSATTLCRSREG